MSPCQRCGHQPNATANYCEECGERIRPPEGRNLIQVQRQKREFTARSVKIIHHDKGSAA